MNTQVTVTIRDTKTLCKLKGKQASFEYIHGRVDVSQIIYQWVHLMGSNAYDNMLQTVKHYWDK